MPAAARRRRSARIDTPELADLATAAAYLHMHPRTVRRMLAAGELTAYRVRKQIRVDMREVRGLVRVVPPESIPS